MVIVGNAPNLVENVQSVEKPSVNTKALLLANEAFNKEHGGYESEKPEEERRDQVDDYNLHKNLLDGVAVSKKRKASEELHSTKYELSSPYVDSSFKKNCGRIVWRLQLQLQMGQWITHFL